MPYYSIARTTSDCYCALLTRHDNLLALEDFQAPVDYNQQLVCSDGDDAVTLALRGRSLMPKREDTQSLRTGCTSHEASADRENVGLLDPGLTSRMTHLALSVRGSTNVRTLKFAFRVVFLRLATPMSQMPSTLHRENNMKVLNFWMPDGRKTKVANSKHLGMLMKGAWVNDWAVDDKWTHMRDGRQHINKT